MCTILYLTRLRQDLQATAKWMRKRLRDPGQKSWTQVVKTVRYIKGSEDLTHFMPRSGKTDSIEATSMETGLVTTLTGQLHLEGV